MSKSSKTLMALFALSVTAGCFWGQPAQEPIVYDPPAVVVEKPTQKYSKYTPYR